MKYTQLIAAFNQRPFFETADLLALFPETESQILPRLSRWVSQGKIQQLRRGKYLLPMLYQKITPHPFYISNYLYSPSYISLFTALAHYQLIPEHTPLVQAVTTRTTRHWTTPAGHFHFHSLKTDRFLAYRKVQLGNSLQQDAFVATPEKALIDICLLNQGEWDKPRWSSLRLQHTEALNPDTLLKITRTIPSKKLKRGIDALVEYISS